jgi:hypothetical protein
MEKKKKGKYMKAIGVKLGGKGRKEANKLLKEKE